MNQYLKRSFKKALHTVINAMPSKLRSVENDISFSLYLQTLSNLDGKSSELARKVVRVKSNTHVLHYVVISYT